MDQPASLEQLESALQELGESTVLGGILLLIFSLHIPLLNYPLVYDDGWVLITNGFLREPDWSLLSSPAALEQHVPDAFRPVSVWVDHLTYRAFGLDATAHHGLSIALHLGACVGVWAWLRRLGSTATLACASALLFGVAALHAEVVAVVSYREDLLAAVFGLGSLWLASDLLRRPGNTVAFVARFVLVAATSLLACGAKLSAAPLPLLWLAFETVSPFSPQPVGRRSTRALVFTALALGVAAALAHRSLLTGGLSPYELEPGSHYGLWSHRVGETSVWAASAQIQLAYLGQALLPLGLSPEYTDFGSSWSDLATLLAAACLISLVSVAIAFADRGTGKRLFSACVLGGLALLLPTANLIPMPNMRADRFTYLASIASSIGLAALVLGIGQRLYDRQPKRGSKDAAQPRGAWLALAPLLVFAVVQASFERAATSAFFSNTTLWATARDKAPDSARAHAMFGLMRLAAGDGRARRDPELRQRVAADCRRAEILDPLEARAHVCFARLAAELGEVEEAHWRFSRAIALDPRHSASWLGARAQLSLDLDASDLSEEELRSRRSRALAELDEAMLRFPYSEELQLVAGRLAHRLGQPERAAGHYRRARSLRPERWESITAELELQLDLGHIPGAHRLWLQEAKLLKHANPAVRSRLRRLIADGTQLGLSPHPSREATPKTP